MTEHTDLIALWWHGINAVRGFSATSSTLKKITPAMPNMIIAVGKAASDMTLGARDYFGVDIPTLVVTKYGHIDTALTELSACDIFEAAHPLPDTNSLKAGAAVLDTVRILPEMSTLLLLVSGGASSLVEVLQSDLTLNELEQLNRNLIAQGISIAEMNAKRKEFSQIKGGKLLANFRGKIAYVIAISDVEGDNINVIGSGIGACNNPNVSVHTTIAASNNIARQAIAAHSGTTVIFNDECLYDDVSEAARIIFSKLEEGPSGLYIFGGEPTVLLPDNPGRGGRNQHLALLLAQKISGRNDLTILVAGTDGTDGPTGDAGACINGETISTTDDITKYLNNADAGTFLAQCGALFSPGPTGTNVMDIIIAAKT